MQYIDKNLIIERYINGSMSPTEVQNFHTMLEKDGELRSMFRAENLLNSTIGRDRVALEAADHSRMYATFLKNLADSIPQAATASAAAGSSGATSWLASLGTSAKAAMLAIAVMGSMAVLIALYPSSSTERAAVPAPQIETPAASVPIASPEAPKQHTPVAVRSAGNSRIATQAQSGKAEQKLVPNAEKSTQTEQVSVQDSIPVINRDVLDINMQAERKR